MNKEYYVALIQFYFEVGAVSDGKFDGKIHIELPSGNETDILM